MNELTMTAIRYGLLALLWFFVFAVVGVLRGEEISVSYERSGDGTLKPGPAERLPQGSVAAVSPDLGDIHAISNGLPDRSSISIHVYGGNIGTIRRSIFDARTGAAREFISGYSNEAVPNLWLRHQVSSA